MALIEGTAGDDRLTGTEDADDMQGLQGDDLLFGKAGDDTLTGGNGDDRLDGGEGADAMAGGQGNDAYYVDDAGDIVTEAAGEGLDTLRTTVSYALAAGSEIERFVAEGTLAINLAGNELANRIHGNGAANMIGGNAGDDNLHGLAGDDTLNGGDGRDVLDGGTGADTMEGGTGNDVYFVDNAADRAIEQAGEGTDRVMVSVSWVLDITSEIEQLYSQGGAAIDLTGSDTANRIVANNAANTLSGMGGDDRITARGGNDMLLGGDGNDVLIGGLGADSMVGGLGDDTFYVDDAGDTVIEAAGAGTDRVMIDTSWTLGAGQHVEQLIARGNGYIEITGNELANEIFGNAGINILSGGGGDDTIHGGGGDTLIGDGGADHYIITGGAAGSTRVIGDAEDTLSTGDSGWKFLGTVMQEGALLSRFARGTTTLVTDAAVDATGVQDAETFGQAMSSGGHIRQVISLSTIAADRGFIIQGEAEFDRLGRAVSSAGDINGDGFDDLIVAAPYANGVGASSGRAFVVFGGTSFGVDDNGRQVIDLTTLDAAQGFVIEGEAAGDLAGISVSSAGDVNSDGYDDVIVGAERVDLGGTSSGAAYVIFGHAGTFGAAVGGRQVISLAGLTAAEGFVIQGYGVNSFAGAAVSQAGDVNGDGFDDLIIGADGMSPGGALAGAAYVVFGGAGGFGTGVGGRQIIDLAGLTAAQGFLIQGDTDLDQAGASVAAAGDVNGDGFDDLIIGAPNGTDAGFDAGEAYVVFGGAGGFGSNVGGRQVIDLTSLSASQGFIIQADTGYDRAGYSVSSAGDVNNDGFGDLIVGAPNGADGGDDAGEAYVVFGGASGFGSNVGGRQVIDLTTLTASQGFIIQGHNQGAGGGSQTGYSVSSAGDVNGDGFADLMVGANLANNLRGEAFVVFGGSDGFGTDVGGRQVLDMASLAGTQGFVIRGDSTGDWAGRAVSAAGDVNGDGFDDLIVGASLGDDAAVNSGEAYVVFGGPTGFTLAQIAGTDGGDNLTGTAAEERLIGGRGNDMLTGNGGADVFLGGEGDDVIDIGRGNFLRVDGGTGSDRLITTADLDFTLMGSEMIRHIEMIDVLANGPQTVTLDAGDVLALGATNRDVLGTTHDNVLIIYGDVFDRADLSGLTGAGSVSFGGDDWNLFAINGNVVLAVDSDMTLV